jgi:hypothetical protein
LTISPPLDETVHKEMQSYSERMREIAGACTLAYRSYPEFDVFLGSLTDQSGATGAESETLRRLIARMRLELRRRGLVPNGSPTT